MRALSHYLRSCSTSLRKSLVGRDVRVAFVAQPSGPSYSRARRIGIEPENLLVRHLCKLPCRIAEDDFHATILLAALVGIV